MKTIIRSIDRTITAEEIIPLLNKYGMLSRLAYEDIIDRAIAQIECTPQEIAIASGLWQHQQNKSKTSPLNKEEFLASAIRNLKIEKFKQQNFSDGLPAYFTRGKKQLDRVIYSLVKTKTQEVAREMYFRLIEAEQTFAELAQERKENLQIEASEAIGWVELGTLQPLIAQQLSTLQVNSVSSPIPIGKCYVILRLEKYLSAQCDRAMQKRLRDELFNQWMQQQLMKQKYHLENITYATSQVKSYEVKR